MTFTVKLSVATTTPVTVKYATEPGTAVAATDFTPRSGMVTFAAGETARR